MLTLPDQLRALARQCDVRRPILPPPGLCSALLAAAEELERGERKRVSMTGELQRLARVEAAAQALKRALDQT